jgi:hypothetical protein
MAHEITNKSEKDTHDARIKAKQAEEAVERERRIGYLLMFIFGICFCGFGLINFSHFS